MDVHVPMAITRALRRYGFDVIRAQEDETHQMSDPDLLDRVTALGRILFTQDEDFLTETVTRLRLGREFATVVYAHQFEPIGCCVSDLKLILEVATSADMRNNLLRLPL